MAPFLELPEVPRLRLAGLTAPACFVVGATGADGLTRLDLDIVGGRIAAAEGEPDATVETGGAFVLPAPVDMHTHLDKGHIWARTPNPDGTFESALASVGADREACWSAEDVRARMTFALEAAYAHGSRAIRTHLDSIPPQHRISWPIFGEIKEDWAGRIDLQAVNLVGIDRVDDGPEFREIAETVAAHDGVLGAVTYPVGDLDQRLDTFFQIAAELGLDADFHTDETLDPASATLRNIALAVERTGFVGRVVAGHCCSLSTQTDEVAAEIIGRVADAGIHIVSLPLCNLYLQDRQAGRTPRYRGVTLVHELKAAGVPVRFASDNTRDPFYAYGDLDMLEVMREAWRIAHLDHSDDDWIRAFTTGPAETCGFAAAGLAPGDPADLILCRARSWTELFARPQFDRIVLRDGKAIDRRVPDYARLDALME
ncbi:MAG: cytosine deaminase [Pseudomonadota bacterium]